SGHDGALSRAPETESPGTGRPLAWQAEGEILSIGTERDRSRCLDAIEQPRWPLAHIPDLEHILCSKNVAALNEARGEKTCLGAKEDERPTRAPPEGTRNSLSDLRSGSYV